MRQASRCAFVWGISLFIVLTNQAGGQTPPLVLTGSPGNRLGLSMENAGDVNGDGIEDLIIGADHYFGDRKGEAQIYFGGSPRDFIPDVILVGDSGEIFGWSVAGAGDVNGDGYDDVLVSTLGTAVYLYFGGDPMDTIPDAVIPAVPTTTVFGLKVAGAGDVNGDGYDDFLVCSVSERGIYLYFGSPSPGTTPSLTFAGASRAQAAGDMNKDGYDDIIVGNPVVPPDPSWAALHFGGAAMDTIPDLIYRTGLGDSFGSSLAGKGDLNGDGWPDLVISAAGDSSGGVAAGRAYVFFGGPVLDTIPDFTYTGSGDYDLVGYKEAAMLGDIDFDGYDDFCVSSDVYIDPSAGMMGKVHFFRGGPVISEDTTFVGEDDKGNFGWSVAPIDFDGDDDIEVFIGAFYAPYQLKSGKVYLYEPPLATLTIDYPNGGEVWLIGETKNILWTSQNVDSVTIELSTDGGTSWRTIDSIPSSGTYSWIVTASDSSDKCLIKISDIQNMGVADTSDDFFKIDITTSIENSSTNTIPKTYALSQNYPNPFNPGTTMHFDLPERSRVTLKVYDLLGREVATLIDATLEAGVKSVEFVPQSLSSGVYFYQVRAGAFEATRKMVLMR